MEPENSLFTILNVFFPRLKLWRSFRLQYGHNKKTYSHPEGAVYIKHGYKIFIVGGYRVQFTYEEKPKDPKEKVKYDQIKREKKAEMTKEVVEIDLSQIIKELLEPTRTIELDSTEKSKIKSIKKSVSNREVIDKMFKNPIFVKLLTPLPEFLCNGAGEILNNNIYVFGGCVLKNNGTVWTETITGNSYIYNIGNNTWKQLDKLPTPRAYHSVVKSKNLLFIIGGSP